MIETKGIKWYVHTLEIKKKYKMTSKSLFRCFNESLTIRKKTHHEASLKAFWIKVSGELQELCYTFKKK